VRNEDDADSVSAQVVDDLEKFRGLPLCERRCRFVHDDQLGVESDGFCDLDQLLHPDAQATG
jgi:hypothetical protein